MSKSRNLKEFIQQALVSVLTLSLLTGGVGMNPTSAWASADDIKQAKHDVSDATAAVAQDKLRIKDIQVNLDMIDTDTSPEYSGSCANCKPGGSACSTDFFTNVMNLSASDIASLTSSGNSCFTIYDTFQGNLSSVPSACSQQVKKCGDVARDIAKKRLASDLKLAKKQLEDDQADLAAKKSALEDAKNDCPNCDMIAAQNAARGSTDNTAAWITGGVAALGLGLNAYMGITGMNQQSKSYNNYLNSCTTVGVPCAPPSFGGGYGGGMFGGGLGGLGIMAAMGGAMMGGSLLGGGGLVGGGYLLGGGGLYGGGYPGGGLYGGIYGGGFPGAIGGGYLLGGGGFPGGGLYGGGFPGGGLYGGISAGLYGGGFPGAIGGGYLLGGGGFPGAIAGGGIYGGGYPGGIYGGGIAGAIGGGYLLGGGGFPGGGLYGGIYGGGYPGGIYGGGIAGAIGGGYLLGGGGFPGAFAGGGLYGGGFSGAIGGGFPGAYYAGGFPVGIYGGGYPGAFAGGGLYGGAIAGGGFGPPILGTWSGGYPGAYASGGYNLYSGGAFPGAFAGGGYPGAFAGGGYPGAFAGGGYPGGFPGGFPGGGLQGPPNFTSAWGTPGLPYGTGFNSPLFPYNPYSNPQYAGLAGTSYYNGLAGMGGGNSTDLLLAQQQAYSAAQRVNQVAQAGYGYGGFYGGYNPYPSYGGYAGYSSPYSAYSGGSGGGGGRTF